MKKVVITGSNGQLGQCIKKAVQENPPKGYEFIFFDRTHFDLTRPEVIEAYFFSNKVDVLVNCGAYTAVDNAEKEVEQAFKINADAVGLLAKECALQNATFIHISTDYVYDGSNEEPYTESDLTQPLGVYGKSKLEGERLAMDENPDSIIIRTSWLYSQFGKNFLNTMLRLFNEKEELNIVSDQKGTPTNANDLAQAILKIIKTKEKTPGIYQFSNSGETTWFGFAEAIKELTNSKIKLNPIPTSAYPTPAQRPAYSVLDKSKIVEVFGVEVADWRESLGGIVG